MAAHDSMLEPADVARARALLLRAAPRERLWPPLAAALVLALTSLGFAVAMVTAPPLVKEHTLQRAPGG